MDQSDLNYLSWKTQLLDKHLVYIDISLYLDLITSRVVNCRSDLDHPSGGSRISPRRGRQLPGGAPTYDFAKNSQKLHEIERIWTPRGGARPKFYYVDPPLHPVCKCDSLKWASPLCKRLRDYLLSPGIISKAEDYQVIVLQISYAQGISVTSYWPALHPRQT